LAARSSAGRMRRRIRLTRTRILIGEPFCKRILGQCLHAAFWSLFLALFRSRILFVKEPLGLASIVRNWSQIAAFCRLCLYELLQPRFLLLAFFLGRTRRFWRTRGLHFRWTRRCLRASWLRFRRTRWFRRTSRLRWRTSWFRWWTSRFGLLDPDFLTRTQRRRRGGFVREISGDDFAARVQLHLESRKTFAVTAATVFVLEISGDNFAARVHLDLESRKTFAAAVFVFLDFKFVLG